MKQRFWQFALISVMVFLLAACGSSKQDGATDNKTASQPESGQSQTASTETAKGTREITYLGKTYTVPEKVENIVVAGSIESMEDALVLDVNLAGASSVGGGFPQMFADITKTATDIGQKQQPNFETMLKLKPDVILGSTKFPADKTEKMEKIAPTIPVSHKAVDWEANLLLLAELTGKQDQANDLLEQYKKDLEAAKPKIGAEYKDKKVIALRLRGLELCLYAESVFFNPTLYEELGLSVPAEIAATKKQEIISIEKFSEINPDVIFLQFAESENKKNVKILEELQNNPIWKNLDAVKNNKVFINVVDPDAQGGTFWSKQQFLKAAVEKLGS
ncbi:ABC transporter substrate-binding protein [Paenibacillus sp. SC116]|uniref:ABC transporter substrate-binding protein n=1 Tax=Paenibacillus sp. SC116 TaxID=2968986 RepID=UPI00215A345F|nr:ABC transporter substrate-binding protein [Paenibacillus sp. SC116]MCR8844193.1 ABC transporter substrate-binding protein [Paenibacillus sp. SC116]